MGVSTQSTWGRFVAKRRRGKMKTILALTLAAFAAAEPEADADAYYGLGGYYGGYGLGGYGGYRTYGLGSYGVYGKREAEPKADADAYYGYGGYGLGGYYGGYRTLGLGYGHSVYGYGKREAEPYYGVYSAGHVAPVVSYAHHAPVVHTVGHPVVSSYASVSPSASLTTLGAAPAAIPAIGGAYAGAGRYVATSAGTVHVAKREAEAEPYYYGGYHGLGYRGLGYGHGYGYGFYG